MKKLIIVCLMGFVFSGCAGLEQWGQRIKYQEQLQDNRDQHKFTIGMSVDEIVSSIGRPISMNKLVLPTVLHTQWIYRANHRPMYLYFENLTLTSWRN